jgi:hypothetical protein
VVADRIANYEGDADKKLLSYQCLPMLPELARVLPHPVSTGKVRAPQASDPLSTTLSRSNCQPKAGIDDAPTRSLYGRGKLSRPPGTLMRPAGRTPRSRGQTPGLAPVIRRHHVDKLVDDYVSWREACAAVSAAYDKWRCAGRDDQALAFSVYIAALDGEEAAATLYQQAVERLAAMTLA